MNSQNSDPTHETESRMGLLGRAAIGAVSGLLRFAQFSGLVITTRVENMEEGLIHGGSLSCQGPTDDLSAAACYQLRNSMVMCTYRVNTVVRGGKSILAESIDIVRVDMPGGAILNFYDKALVGGITNSVRRIFFHPEEVKCAGRILSLVSERIAAEKK